MFSTVVSANERPDRDDPSAGASAVPESRDGIGSGER
jgi:hypothetical protein